MYVRVIKYEYAQQVVVYVQVQDRFQDVVDIVHIFVRKVAAEATLG